MNDPVPNPSAKPQSKPAFKRCLIAIGLGIGFFLLCGVCLGPITPGVHHPWHNAAMQQSRQIGQCMVAYASDHNGKYPDGNSSTEVFQKLIDGGYVTDPDLFYVPLIGKVKCAFGQKLKPEDVCWDVTQGVDSKSSELVPFVFMTGYRIKYASGGSAAPIIKPYPPFWPGPMSQLSHTEPISSPGIAVCYKGDNAAFWRAEPPDYTVPNFISPDFKPDGHTYHQLTPDGVLPP